MLSGLIAYEPVWAIGTEKNADNDTIEAANKAIRSIIKELKYDINNIGKSLSGLNIYSFKYKDTKYGEGTYQGVMSDEIPQYAVYVNSSGFDIVDYNKIDVNFKQI